MALVSGWCLWGVLLISFGVYRKNKKNRYLEKKRDLEEKKKNLDFMRIANTPQPPLESGKIVIKMNENPKYLEKLDREVQEHIDFISKNKDLENV
jgi:hypothetical protein